MNLLNFKCAAAANSLQSCPTLCDPIDGSPPGSPVPGIFQARTLEWVAISFSNAWKWKMKVKPLSHVWLFTTPWTVAYQAPPSTGFSRQEYWSRLPLPSPQTWIFDGCSGYLWSYVTSWGHNSWLGRLKCSGPGNSVSLTPFHLSCFHAQDYLWSRVHSCVQKCF